MSAIASQEGIPVRPVAPQELLGPLMPLEMKFAPSVLYVAGHYRVPLTHPRVADRRHRPFEEPPGERS